MPSTTFSFEEATQPESFSFEEATQPATFSFEEAQKRPSPSLQPAFSTSRPFGQPPIPLPSPKKVEPDTSLLAEAARLTREEEDMISGLDDPNRIAAIRAGYAQKRAALGMSDITMPPPQLPEVTAQDLRTLGLPQWAAAPLAGTQQAVARASSAMLTPEGAVFLAAPEAVPAMMATIAPQMAAEGAAAIGTGIGQIAGGGDVESGVATAGQGGAMLAPAVLPLILRGGKPSTREVPNALQRESEPVLPGVRPRNEAEQSGAALPVKEEVPPTGGGGREAASEGGQSRLLLNAQEDPIVAAAYRTPDGKVITGLQGKEQVGVTHMEADLAAAEQGVKVDESMAGFVTRSGKFLNRDEAYNYSKSSGQLASELDTFESGKLHSGKVSEYAPTEAARPTEAAKPPEPKPETAKEPLIFGKTWEEIQAMQQGKKVGKTLLPFDPVATKAKIESDAVKFKNPQSAPVVEAVGAKLPEGYVKEGALYVFKEPDKAAEATKAGEGVRAIPFQREIANQIVRGALPESALGKDVVDVSRTTVLRGTGESTSYHPMVTVSRNGKRIWRGTANEFADTTLEKITGETLTEAGKAGKKSLWIVEPKTTEHPPESISRGPGAAAAGETGTYRPIQQLTDQLTVIGEGLPPGQKIDAISKAPVLERVKDAATSALAKANAVRKAIWDGYVEKAPAWTDEKQAAGNWFYALQRADHEARMFAKQIARSVPNRLKREGITNWIQADGDPAVLRERMLASKAKYRPGYEAALKLSPKEIEVAQRLREYFDQQLARGISEDILREGLDHYITQVWKRDNPITRALKLDFAPGKLPINFKFARKRIFDSYFEGEQKGYAPANKDVGALVALYDQSFNRTLSARAYLKELHEGTASDGRPLVEVSGYYTPVPEGVETKAILLKPRRAPEELSDYRSHDHPALRGWKYATTTPEGKPIIVQDQLLIHPEAFTKLKNRLSVSGWRQNPVGRAVLGAQSTLKQTMLSISGFHQAQETIHALGHRVNPANLATLDFERPVVKELATHGLQLADYHAMELFSEGLGSGPLTNKLPVIGKVLKPYTEWLFQDYIPRLKLTMAEHALERNLKRYPNLSRDAILEMTASQANAAFGELPYRYWGRNPALQDTLRAFLLAPDFLEARGRFVGQAMKPGGREQLVALGFIAATTYLTARVLNQIMDGDPHMEPKHAFSLVAGGHAYTLRTVPGDLMHLVSDPRSFWYNRLSPVLGRGTIEWFTGRDDRAVKRNLLEQAKDLSSSIVPISMRKRDDQHLWESFLNAFGVGTRRYTALQEIGDLAKQYREAHGRKEPFEFIYDPKDDVMRPIRIAVENDDPKAFQAAYSQLAKTRNPKEIVTSMERYYHRPFTGSTRLDRAFHESLSATQKEVFREARDSQIAQLSTFRRLMREALSVSQ